MTQTQKLSGGRFEQADYSIGRYAARPPAGTTLADVLHPEYFQNHLNVLRPGMEIVVLSEDFELDCKLRVLTVFKTSTKMRVLDVYAGDHPAEESTQVSDCDVTWGGPQHKWRFLHAGEVIEHGFATQDEAKAAAAKYLETIKG